MTTKYIRWWGFISVDLGNMKHTFMAIISRSIDWFFTIPVSSKNESRFNIVFILGVSFVFLFYFFCFFFSFLFFSFYFLFLFLYFYWLILIACQSVLGYSMPHGRESRSFYLYMSKFLCICLISCFCFVLFLGFFLFFSFLFAFFFFFNIFIDWF